MRAAQKFMSLARRSLNLQGGRSSVSGITATVFGATGFLGRYVVNRLGKTGTRVVVPFRGDEKDVRHLKVMGDLGVVNFVETSIRSLEQIEAAVADADVVINLLGKHYETLRWRFADVHTSFPAVLAEVCAAQGVERLVHVSALGAAADSPSEWARTKAMGEQALHEAFPAATIVRPASMFGDEDRFLNRIALMGGSFPFIPMVDGGASKQQPVYVDDAAAAIVECVANPECAGQTYTLAGPRAYTNKELTQYVHKTIAEPYAGVDVPAGVGMALAFGVQQLPDPWLTCDALRRESVDLVMPDGAPGLAALGVAAPVAIEDVAERYLMRFKKNVSHFVDEEEQKVVRAPN